jgi:hypothetical protein
VDTPALRILQPELHEMAANYWESTQRRYWQFTRQQLDDLRKKLEEEDQNLVQMYPLPQLRYLSIYFNQRMFEPLALEDEKGRKSDVLAPRNCSTWEEARRTATGNGYRPIIYSSFLLQG